MSFKLIILTELEYRELKEIIRNGWGDGDFKGYGKSLPQNQERAMKKFDNAAEIGRPEKGTIERLANLYSATREKQSRSARTHQDRTTVMAAISRGKEIIDDTEL